MGRLFGRQVLVQLGRENSTGIEHKDLRVTFDVEMDDSSVPSKARIEVYNLASDTIATMQRDDAVIRLLTGYRSSGGVPRLIFQGNPIPGGANLERRSVDKILKVEAQDGGREYSASHISESFSTATSSGQLFQTLADAFGKPLGNVDAVVGDIAFKNGLVMVGPTRDQMDRIADMSGAQWSFRDGTLQVWKTGSTTGEPAVVFSADAGNLIGSPVATDQGVKITGLLAPSLRPGKPFRVQSADINGDFVATSVQFKGDSGFSNEYYVIATGTRI